MKKIIVLLSGRGSNFEALYSKQSEYGSYKIIKVYSDNPAAKGLELATKFGIPCETFAPDTFPSRSALTTALFNKLASEDFDYIALAGFMRIVPKEFVTRFYGRIINIHPSLLPDLPGLNTHERALEAGLTQHGCTVHFVDAGVDTGPVIAQRAVPVLPGDTAQTLAARVLKEEHEVYPAALHAICTEA